MHQHDGWSGVDLGDEDTRAQVSSPTVSPGLRVVAAAILGSIASALIYAAMALAIYAIVHGA